MEKAKDVTYKINLNSTEDLGNNTGTQRYNAKESSEGNVVIDILVAKDTKEGTEKKDKRVVLADELEHGRQFLDGELGYFITKDGTSSTFGYDQQDEIKSQQASVDATKALGIELNGLQKEFTNRTSDLDFIKNYYPDLNTALRAQNLDGKSGLKNAAEVKDRVITRGGMQQVVYRENGKNVIIK